MFGTPKRSSKSADVRYTKVRMGQNNQRQYNEIHGLLSQDEYEADEPRHE